MRIIIIQQAGRDYPDYAKNNKAFRDEQKKMIRKRLALRPSPSDTIEIYEEDDE